ncbi:hypothetical protein G3A43_09400 [Paraburkholderia aspalathi]|nr:hypothetical protein [Paraburkholderia aspalathi]MBK3780441.1 hypothetical protein [Paraburkholderia aspalathi]
MSRITFSSIISRLLNLSKAAQSRAKIEQLFQVNNRLRQVNVNDRSARVVFRVYEVDDSRAFVMSEDETVAFYPTWLSNDGRFMPHVADQWELVQEAPSFFEMPKPLVVQPTGRFNPEYLAAIGH